MLVRTSQAVHDIADPTLPNIEYMGISPVQIARPHSVFLLVRRYKPLKDAQDRDPYRAFGFALAGCLFYDELSDLEVVRAQDVVCPFASTPQRETDADINEHNLLAANLSCSVHETQPSIAYAELTSVRE